MKFLENLVLIEMDTFTLGVKSTLFRLSNVESKFHLTHHEYSTS